MKKVDKSFCERDHESERILQRVKSPAGVLSKAFPFKIHFFKTNKTFFAVYLLNVLRVTSEHPAYILFLG